MPRVFQEGAPELAPEWSSSNPVEHGRSTTMYRNNSGSQRVIATAETEDGFIAVSVPHARYEKWIDTSGGQANLVTSNTRDTSVDCIPYRESMRRKRASQGWVPYDYHVARMYCPDMVGNRSEAEWPARLLEISEKYKAQHRRKDKKIAQKANGPIEQFLDEVKKEKEKAEKVVAEKGKK